MPEPTTGVAGRRRRGGARQRNAGKQLRVRLRELLLSPNILQLSLVLVAGVLASATVMLVFRGQPLVADGRIADRTRVVRVDFDRFDADATAKARETARSNAPRVYVANSALLEEIRVSLTTLPATLTASESLEGVAESIRAEYGLDAERFSAIRSLAPEGTPAPGWVNRVDRFVGALEGLPILSTEEFGLANQSATRQLLLKRSDGSEREVGIRSAISLGSADAGERLEDQLDRFLSGVELGVAVRRVLSADQPTFTFDKAATDDLRAKRAAETADVYVRYRVGESIYTEGERISEDAVQLTREEWERYRASQPLSQRATGFVGMLALSAVFAALIGGYVRTYYPRAANNPARAGALAALVVGGQLLAALGATGSPSVLWFATLGPVALVSMIIVTAYDRRIAVMVASTLAMLIGITLSLETAYFAAAIVGAIVSAWRLSGVRHRVDVLRGGLIVGAALLVTTLAVHLVSRPTILPAVWEILTDALIAGLAGFLAAAITLVILPVVEKVFGIVTGMTLSELRDSSHPLLRQLQQKAPGTFNHSHTVAIIAEAAADAIGADSMHVYVGAMYHDIGKMNKPEYFIENIGSGQRTVHDRLSPAMSLLVIVAHVKDGVELAKEGNLPRSLHHYIESHHGTTLVQYFFHRAKEQAERGEGGAGPSEVEYRYPGPRPQTKEAAVLMLADSVEAATRAMAEPTPARIGALVREISRKYLADGQFDESALTFRELNLVEDSVIKSLCGIYHGRVAYPTKGEKKPTGDERSAESASASAVMGS